MDRTVRANGNETNPRLRCQNHHRATCMTWLIRILAFAIAPLSAMACMQRYGTSLEGGWIQVNGGPGRHAYYQMTNFPKVDWRGEAKRLEGLAALENARFQEIGRA